MTSSQSERVLDVLLNADCALAACEIGERIGIAGFDALQCCYELGRAGMAFETLGVWGGWLADV